MCMVVTSFQNTFEKQVAEVKYIGGRDWVEA